MSHVYTALMSRNATWLWCTARCTAVREDCKRPYFTPYYTRQRACKRTCTLSTSTEATVLPCRQALAVGCWSLQTAVAASPRAAARPLHARSRSPARSCLSSNTLTSHHSTASSQRAHTPAGLQRRSRPQLRKSVPAVMLPAAHQFAHQFVAVLLLAAPQSGLPRGGQTGRVVPCTSESSDEMPVKSGPVEQNAEPALARP